MGQEDISVVKANDDGEYEEIDESLHMFYLKNISLRKKNI